MNMVFPWTAYGFLAFGVFTLLGCSGDASGPEDASVRMSQGATESGEGNAKGAAPSTGRTAVLLIGGFFSCPSTDDAKAGTDATQSAMRSWKEKILKTGKVDGTLMTCYNSQTNTNVANALDNMIYVDDQLGSGKKAGSAMKLKDFLDNLPGFTKGISKVAIVGHSYGGYTAILAAERILRQGGGTRLTGLYTLDPISMAACTPKAFLGGASGKPAEGCTNNPTAVVAGADPLGKRMAPSEVAASTKWTNFFQESDRLLHSSQVETPKVKNRKVTKDPGQTASVVNHMAYLKPDEGEELQHASEEIVNEIRSDLE